MPYMGVVFLCAQILCAVHAGRTGRPFFWIYLIIFVPVVGMLAYLAIELAPELLGGRHARRAAHGVAKALNPTRQMREAERRLRMTPTAENKTALAEAYLAANRTDESLALFQDAATGIHASDPAILMGLARAHFARGEFAETGRVLEQLRQANPDYASPEGHLLYAKSLEARGKLAEALKEYAALAPYYPGEEARCRYALLLQRAGRGDEARRIFEEICQEAEDAPATPGAPSGNGTISPAAS